MTMMAHGSWLMIDDDNDVLWKIGRPRRYCHEDTGSILDMQDKKILQTRKTLVYTYLGNNHYD